MNITDPVMIAEFMIDYELAYTQEVFVHHLTLLSSAPLEYHQWISRHPRTVSTWDWSVWCGGEQICSTSCNTVEYVTHHSFFHSSFPAPPLASGFSLCQVQAAGDLLQSLAVNQ